MRVPERASDARAKAKTARVTQLWMAFAANNTDLRDEIVGRDSRRQRVAPR